VAHFSKTLDLHVPTGMTVLLYICEGLSLRLRAYDG
jgi:hypothetical protein